MHVNKKYIYMINLDRNDREEEQMAEANCFGYTIAEINNYLNKYAETRGQETPAQQLTHLDW
jgi:hypothetical protein